MAFAHEKNARLDKNDAEIVYEKPAITAEGKLSVRAGSTGAASVSGGRGGGDDSDLFTEPVDDK